MAPARTGRAWLDVPYSDKDHAKALGARWDGAARRWYAPRPGLPTLGFAPCLPGSGSGWRAR